MDPEAEGREEICRIVIGPPEKKARLGQGEAELREKPPAEVLGQGRACGP